MGSQNLSNLADAGVSIWLDDLSRVLLDSGELRRRIDEMSVVGVTTNPAIFHAAISKSDVYDDALAEAADHDASVDSVVAALTTTDVRDACAELAPIFEATDGVDGRVSIEVDPRMSGDTAGTVAQAHDLIAAVDSPNVMIKIPATEQGMPAIAETIGGGIDVNVTLIFSPEQYRDVATAYLDGLDMAKAAGRDLSSIHSVASVFVSRVDSAVDAQLDASSPLRGKAAIANARLAYQVYEEVFSHGDRFAELAKAGARPQRPLWASTGVKDPAYSDTMYVSELVAENTVNTMPYATMQAFADHGEVRGDTFTGTTEDAAAVMAELEASGIDMNVVYAELLQDGLDKFVSAWGELLEAVRTRISTR